MKNLLFLTLCFLATILSAQQNNSANWTQHQFLNEVNDIAETENDMWFATNTGLVRMNKITLDKTLYHPYNSPLPQQHIEAVAVDADGQLFIGIYDNIMARFDGDDDWDIIDIPVDEAVASEPEVPLLYTIFVDNENEKWVGTSSGLLHYKSDGTWETFNDGTLGNTSISLRDVWDITQTDNGDLYVSSFEIYKYDGESLTNIADESGDLFSYGDTSIESYGDEVWFSSPQTLSARYSNGTWEIFEAEGEINGLPSGLMSDLKLDQAGVPYVTYESTNIGVYKFENNVWSSVNDAQINGIEQGISSIYFSENSDRWLTAKGDIFYRNATTDMQFVLQESPLVADRPRLVREAPDGSIYCYSGSFFSRKLVKFSSPTDWEEINLSDDFTDINDMEVTSTGSLIASTAQGIFQYQNGTWIEITGFPALIPNKIALDSEDGIWVMTNFSGLHYYNDGIWTSYTAASSGLSNDQLSSVSVDRNDGVWVVSENQNLEHFDGAAWEIFNQANSALPFSLVEHDLYFDENNELWFPLYNSGIFHYDGTTWENFIPEPVSSLIQYRITADQEGTLYSSSSWGVYNFDGTTWQPFLNEANSLLLNEESTDLLIDQNGFFWMSTEEGLFIYDSAIISAINNPEVLQQDFFTVFPNPATDFISLKADNFTDTNFEMNVYDNAGRLLKTAKMNIGEQLNVSDLSAGIYYLKVNAESGSQIGKFVKQ